MRPSERLEGWAATRCGLPSRRAGYSALIETPKPLSPLSRRNGDSARPLRVRGCAFTSPECVLGGTRADIVGLRADDAAAFLLLEDVRAPAGDPADREQRRERFARDLQRLEQQRGVIFDIGVEPPAGLVPAQCRDRALLDLRGIGQP